MLRKKLLLVPVLFMLVTALLLGACQPTVPPTDEVIPGEEATSLPEEIAPTAEEAPPSVEPTPTASPTEEEINEPQVGGSIVLSMIGDRDTFDVDKTVNSGLESNLIAATLIAFHPETNEFVPYLAESWTVSEDGLTYEFKLREDVKFHNGDPLTAHDFVYAIQRALDPEMASPYAGVLWAPVTGYEAVDDYTLKLSLAEPNFPFLINLADSGTQPLSQRAIEELGEDYGRSPVGVGPYILTEWHTGEKIVLERNPEFTWGPAFLENTGPANIETIEFRILPEYATRIAGLEAGELDLISIENQDLTRIVDDGRFDILKDMGKGMVTHVVFNVSKAPFDNLLVRKAFNLAVNRDAVVTLYLQGNGIPLFGPISHDTIGYDPIVEEIGYGFDLEQAKALMQEAGYTYDDNGMLLTPEGEAFVLDFPVIPPFSTLAEILIEQYKALGVGMNIQIEDFSLNWPRQLAGDFEISIMALGWSDADIMFIGLHSSMLGSVNNHLVNDPVLDEILLRTRTAISQTQRQEAVTEAQVYIVEHAYICPLYSQYIYTAVNKRLQGLIHGKSGDLWFENAYISE